MNRCTSAVNKMSLALVVVCVLLGLPDTTVARSGLQSEESAPPFKVQKCRISCLEKVRKVLIIFFIQKLPKLVQIIFYHTKIDIRG